MKKSILILFLFMSPTFSQTRLFINPGIKVGYAFGESGGFVFGYEFSLVYLEKGDDNSRKGIVIDFDWIKQTKRLHLGFEYLYRFVGTDVGPTLAWNEKGMFLGGSVIPFAGMMALAYYNYTSLSEEIQLHEFGSYLKIPFGEVR